MLVSNSFRKNVNQSQLKPTMMCKCEVIICFTFLSLIQAVSCSKKNRLSTTFVGHHNNNYDIASTLLLMYIIRFYVIRFLGTCCTLPRNGLHVNKFILLRCVYQFPFIYSSSSAFSA